MSKLIKDYKDAMDNIRISDSFYKRTEALLEEKNELLTESKPAVMRRRITAFAGAAAACVMCIIGAKIVLSGEKSEDIAETTVETIESITYEETASPLIDVTETEEDALEEAVRYDEAIDTSDEADTDGGIKASVTSSKPSVEAAAVDNKNKTEAGSSAEAKTEEEALEELPYDVQTEEFADLAPLLSELNSDNITAEITPYFDMDSIKSGEGAIKQTGMECVDIIDCVAEIASKSHKIENYSFVSIFSVSLADKNSGETYYNIYVTDKNTVVINKHSPHGQERFTYGVTAEELENLKHILYLRFGSEENYELFKNLVSGK